MSFPPDISQGSTTALPVHSIRRSGRAKRVSLRVLPGRGLEIVLPRHVDPACVPDILARHMPWIDRAMKRVLNGHEAGTPLLPEAFPCKGGREVIVLHREHPSGAVIARGKRAREIRLPNEIIESTAATALLQASGNGQPSLRTSAGKPAVALTRPAPHARHLFVPEDDPGAAATLIKDWIRGQAAHWLEPMLAELAATWGFSYAAVRFRFQKSRWGSCSARGRINLNACLFFLPEHLARYILVHELCHTRELNHSEAFWKQVFAVDPDALAKDKAMRGAWRHVPGWIWS